MTDEQRQVVREVHTAVQHGGEECLAAVLGTVADELGEERLWPAVEAALKEWRVGRSRVGALDAVGVFAREAPREAASFAGDLLSLVHDGALVFPVAEEAPAEVAPVEEAAVEGG